MDHIEEIKILHPHCAMCNVPYRYCARDRGALQSKLCIGAFLPLSSGFEFAQDQGTSL